MEKEVEAYSIDSVHGKMTDLERREIVMMRILNAPRELVFNAWTNVDYLMKWWGPNGFTVTNLELNVNPGGQWRFIMHGPNSVDYHNRIVYKEVARPVRLIYTHGSDGDDDPTQFQVIVTFEEQCHQTWLTMKSIFPTAKDRDRAVNEFAAIESGNQSFDRLEKELAIMKSKSEITLERVFDVSPNALFNLWIDPKKVARWWGAEGFINPVCQMDVRPGGAIYILMRNPLGKDYPMKGVFREIIKPERLVFGTSAFDDQNGIPLLETLNTVTFTEQNGKTKLTLKVVVAKSSPGTEEAVDEMPDGWNQCLDRLRTISKSS